MGRCGVIATPPIYMLVMKELLFDGSLRRGYAGDGHAEG